MSEEVRPYRQLGIFLSNQFSRSPYQTQAQLAAELGVDRSFLSLVFRGDRRPKAFILGRIGRLLDCEPDDLHRLAEYSGWSIVDIEDAFYRSDRISLSIAEFIDMFRQSILTSAVIRETRSPQDALDELNFWIKRLHDRLQYEHGNNLREMRALLIQALNERIQTKLAFYKRHEAIRAVHSDYLHAVRLADEVGSTRDQRIAQAWCVDACYVGNNFTDAVNRGVAMLNDETMPEHFRGISAMLISYAYIGKRIEFEDLEQRVLNAIEKGIFQNPVDQASLFERIGRARARLGLPDSELWLDQADQTLGQLGTIHMPIRKISILRSRLDALTYSAKPDRDQAENIAESGLELAIGLGYTRHIQQIYTLAGVLKLDRIIEGKPNRLHLDSR